MENDYHFATEAAYNAAIQVLLHNKNGPFSALPRTAGWGYPEPYTRDLMICSFGMLASGNEELIDSLRNTLTILAKNQTKLGDIPSLVHTAKDLGSSDVTPLFLIAVALFREVTGDSKFLEEAVGRSLTWMDYQSPGDDMLVVQMPTTDWRDEQWVWGYGLYVNTLVYIYNVLFRRKAKALNVKDQLNRRIALTAMQSSDSDRGLALEDRPYYALWSFKIYQSDRFDLLGNSLAMLSGIADKSRISEIVAWINKGCSTMQGNGDLALNTPPNLFPFIRENDPDWRDRYAIYNNPGEYHNGGIWPFITAFYVVALLASGFRSEARRQFNELTRLVKLSVNPQLSFGFNEWIKAQSGRPKGQDWQSWSAAMYLYAAKCIELDKAIFFEEFN